MQKLNRFWELDVTRGLAVVLMIVFNYAFALRYFGVASVAAGDLFWFWFPRFVGALFISIAGISLTLSYSRRKKDFFRRNAARGLFIFALGLLVTLATRIFVPQQAVWFGILHLIGASIIIATFFFRFGKGNLLLGLAAILMGVYLQGFSFDFPWLLWLGLMPHNFATLDYWPLLPWFGFLLIGMHLGSVLYKNGKRSFRISETKNPLFSFVALLGRNSLVIYLLHIPALLLVLVLLGFPVA